MEAIAYRDFCQKTVKWGKFEMDSGRYFRDTSPVWRDRACNVLHQIKRMGSQQVVFDLDDATQTMLLAVAKRRVVKNPESYVPWLMLTSHYETCKTLRKIAGFSTRNKLLARFIPFEDAHYGASRTQNVLPSYAGRHKLLKEFFQIPSLGRSALIKKAISDAEGNLVKAAEALWNDVYARAIWGDYDGICDAVENTVEVMLKGDC